MPEQASTTIEPRNPTTPEAQAHTRLLALQEASLLANVGWKATADYILETATRLSQSPYGFYGFVSDDETVMTIHAWSGEAMKNCQMADKPSRYVVADSGVWAEAIRHRKALILNQYADEHPAKHGLPSKHVPLERLLVVPTFRQGRITAVVAVANRGWDYVEEDVEQLVRFMESVDDIAESKQAQLTLQQERDLLQTIMNGAKNTHLVYLDQDFNFVRVNEAYAATCNYRPEEMVGKNHFVLFPNEEMMQVFCRVRDTGEGVEYHDHPFVFPDQPQRGVTYWNWTLTPLKNAQGQVMGLIFALFETTQAVRMELAVREREASLHALLDAIPNLAVQGYTADGTIQYWNKACEEVYGYTRDEAIGRDIVELVIPEPMRAWVRAIITRGVETGEMPEPQAFSLVRKDGSLVTVLTSHAMIREANGQPTFYSIDVDISERERAQKKLQQALAYNRSLIEATIDPMVTIGADGRITDVNQASVRATGFSREELLGTDFADYFTDPDQARRGYQLVFQEATIRDYPLHLRHRNGSSIPVLYNASVYRDEDGEIAGVLATARDITALTQAENEKTKLQEQNRLLQKNESLGRMAAAIAHHYNNLLGAVMGNIELAVCDLQSEDGDPLQALQDALAATHKAAEVSGTMLTYIGQTHPKLSELDIGEFCHRQLTSIRSTLPRNVSLRADFPLPGPRVLASEQQLQQVLTNLTANACEAMKADQGRLVLAVGTVEARDIPRKNLFPPDWQAALGRYATLEVTDNGCGIHSEDMDKLLDPFYSTKFTGRGLGLPVVLGIVRAHQGALVVESELDKGSSFRIYLPIIDHRRRLTAPPRPSAIPSKDGAVLLVEDEPMVRQLAKTMLSRMGHQVMEARDGAEALEIFRKNAQSIYLVLADLTMPKMDGWELLAELRKLAPGLPAILASGYEQADVTDLAQPEQPQVFLSKPYQYARLRQAVSEVLDKTMPDSDRNLPKA